MPTIYVFMKKIINNISELSLLKLKEGRLKISEAFHVLKTLRWISVTTFHKAITEFQEFIFDINRTRLPFLQLSP